MPSLTQMLIVATMIASAMALQCYICNSVNQAECETNYQKFGKPCPVKSFSGQKSVKAIGCRIINQYVNEEYALIRECAYTGEDVNSKSSKGSLGVTRYITQCSTDKCNSTGSIFSVLSSVIAVVALLFVF